MSHLKPFLTDHVAAMHPHAELKQQKNAEQA